MFLYVLNADSRKFKGCFKGVSRQFQKCFKEVSRVESAKWVQENFKKSFKSVSRMFQCSFVVWISSQLPGQKEGLLTFEYVKMETRSSRRYKKKWYS